MLKGLTDKLTGRMLWFLVLPFSLLMLALACLIGTYAWGVWNGRASEIDIGKDGILFKINSVEQQIQTAIHLIDQQQTQLGNVIPQIEKYSLKAEAIKPIPLSKHETLANAIILSDDVTNIISSLKNQSDILTLQKKNLNEANTNLQQFKQELKEHPIFLKK